MTFDTSANGVLQQLVKNIAGTNFQIIDENLGPNSYMIAFVTFYLSLILEYFVWPFHLGQLALTKTSFLFFFPAKC